MLLCIYSTCSEGSTFHTFISLKPTSGIVHREQDATWSKTNLERQKNFSRTDSVDVCTSIQKNPKNNWAEVGLCTFVLGQINKHSRSHAILQTFIAYSTRTPYLLLLCDLNASISRRYWLSTTCVLYRYSGVPNLQYNVQMFVLKTDALSLLMSA